MPASPAPATSSTSSSCSGDPVEPTTRTAGEHGAGTLVLGVGNPLRRDDGAGVRAVARLLKLPLPEGVTVLDGGTGGVDLLDRMRPYARVILLDALRAERVPADEATGRIGDRGSEKNGERSRRGRPRRRPRPGEVVVFRLSHVDLLNPDPRFSLHDASLGAVLRLARTLEIPLPEITVVGVVPAAVGWGTELSPQVREGLARMVGEVHRLLAPARCSA
ncbi:MAG: hydrogenase maturation protease [Candidatus Eisenbacteria bacterium]|nr:hydrogenase maturation protease [Candidatus Latescibacterota bacterium]MBD3301041.1 hydrogenase maturation protease [Candidatus Eisenbacteria bacterium]